MIKGIKKQMIEVNEIDHPYYEKAFLVVKPEYSNFKEKVLKKGARELVKKWEISAFAKKREQIFSTALKFGLAAGIGAGLTVLAMM